MATTKTWMKPQWFDYAAKEYAACREGVAILDYSSFVKFDVWVSTVYSFYSLHALLSFLVF